MVGVCPDWYPLIRAARYLGVPPWELAKQPIIWREWASIAQGAEQNAEMEAIKKARGN